MSIKGRHINIIKATYDKPTVNIMLNSENLKAILLNSGTKQGCLLLPLLFNTVLKILDTAIKGIKYIQIIREEVKLSLYIDNVIL